MSTAPEPFRQLLAELSDLLERYRAAAGPLVTGELNNCDRALLAALADLTRARTALLRLLAALEIKPEGP